MATIMCSFNQFIKITPFMILGFMMVTFPHSTNVKIGIGIMIVCTILIWKSDTSAKEDSNG